MQKNIFHYTFLWLFVLSIVLSYGYFFSLQKKHSSITSFDLCRRAGFPIASSTPRTCSIPGKIFTEIDFKRTIQHPASTTRNDAVDTTIKNTVTYYLDGHPVVTSGGFGLLESENGELLLVHTVGKPYSVDINGDTTHDQVVLLRVYKEGMQVPSGDYYTSIVLGLKDGGYTGTNGVFVEKNITSFGYAFKNDFIILQYKTEERPTLQVKQFSFTKELLTEILTH